MVRHDILPLHVLQPVQFIGNVEDGIGNGLQTEVRLHLILVKVEFGTPHLLGVIPPIPRPNPPFQHLPVLGQELLQHLPLPIRRLLRLRPHVAQQLHPRLRRLRHGVLELILRERRPPVQLRLTSPQPQHIRGDGQIIPLRAQFAAFAKRLEHRLAQIPPPAVRQERFHHAPSQRDDVRVRIDLLPIQRRLTRRGDEVGGTPLHPLRGHDQLPFLLVLQDVLHEGRLQRCQFGLDVGVFGLGGGVEFGAFS
mmetsp:Transcript_5678/g.12396  ORF Transcript_5678/g.12396 Transcript_5678/m.12396 type:complete len:251 (+) Transcript_5678:1210-1962(+)